MKVCFSFQSKDRYEFTTQSIHSILGDAGFDLIWCDGSNEMEVPHFACAIQDLYPDRVRSVEFGVVGGPDVAIRHALRVMLDCDYDWVGLIENDVICQPDWFRHLMRTIEIAQEDDVNVGAASIRGYQSRVLEYRRGYSVDWATGAGMVLFSRKAAQLVLDNYSKLAMTVRQICQFYADRFHRRIISPEWLGAPPDIQVTCDFGFSPLLYSHDLYSVGSIPSHAYDLQFDVRTVLNTSYVTAMQDSTGSPYPVIA